MDIDLDSPTVLVCPTCESDAFRLYGLRVGGKDDEVSLVSVACQQCGYIGDFERDHGE